MDYILMFDRSEWEAFETIANKDRVVAGYKERFMFSVEHGYVIELSRTEYGMLLLRMERSDRMNAAVKCMVRMGETQDDAFRIHLEALRREAERYCLLH